MVKKMTKPKVTQTGMGTNKRIDKTVINDIFCRACGSKLARVVEHQYVHLTGWDRKCMVDLINGTVTVKCKCGVGRVIRSRGDDDMRIGDADVWDNKGTSTDAREPQSDS